ncbi:MAG: hypothetical protein ACK54Y_05720 [Bacteroidota bacterium]|jgi:hypothetical protein
MDKKSMNPPVKGKVAPVTTARKRGQESMFANSKPKPMIDPKFKKK